mgnify:CR=1 FL=1
MPSPLIKNLDIDLRGEFPPVNKDLAAKAVQLVVWVDDVPLGTRLINACDLPIASDELREIAIETALPAIGWHLFGSEFKAGFACRSPSIENGVDLEPIVKLDKPLSHLVDVLAGQKDRIKRKSISIVMCTRDRPEKIDRSLAGLVRLAPQADEIILVDNAPSTNATQKISQKYKGVQYILEPRPGLSIARNTGLRACSGEIIAFTDDDVSVPPAWIAHIEAAFSSKDIMAITGIVFSDEMRTESQAIFHHLLGWGLGDMHPVVYDNNFIEATRHKGAPCWEIGAGANMAFRRSVFDVVGLFDERLGAGAAGCSEDSNMWYRILVAGYSCRYDPTVYVHHEHRTSMEQLHRQIRAYMRGHVVALLIQGRTHRDIGCYRRLLTELPWHLGQRFLRGAFHAFKGEYGLVSSEIAGYLTGFVWYLRYRGRPSVSAP